MVGSQLVQVRDQWREPGGAVGWLPWGELGVRVSSFSWWQTGWCPSPGGRPQSPGITEAHRQAALNPQFEAPVGWRRPGVGGAEHRDDSDSVWVPVHPRASGGHQGSILQRHTQGWQGQKRHEKEGLLGEGRGQSRVDREPAREEQPRPWPPPHAAVLQRHLRPALASVHPPPRPSIQHCTRAGQG